MHLGWPQGRDPWACEWPAIRQVLLGFPVPELHHGLFGSEWGMWIMRWLALQRALQPGVPAVHHGAGILGGGAQPRDDEAPE